MAVIYYILLGILSLLIIIIIFRKNLKRVWFKIPFFEGGIETHTKAIADAATASKAATQSTPAEPQKDKLETIQSEIVERKAVKKNEAKEISPGAQFRKISDLETGKSIHDLPSNIYGFAHASWVYSELQGYKGSLKLTNIQKSNWWFEIIKWLDDVYLLGYVSQDTIAKIGNGRKLEITIFAKSWKEFKNKVSIPLSEISKSSTRDIDTDLGSIMILEIETARVFIM